MAKALNNRRSGHDESKLTAHWTRSKPAPKVATAAPPSISIQGRRVLAIFTDYNGLQKAIAGRREELQITMEELDFLSGNHSGYSSKLLTPTKIKTFDAVSLGNTVGALGCCLALIENEIKAAKILSSQSIPRPQHGRSLAGLDKTLGEVGCTMALIEDPRATEKIMARASKRQRPLRQHAEDK